MVTYETTQVSPVPVKTIFLIATAGIGAYLFAQASTQSVVYNAIGVSATLAMFVGVIRSKPEPRSAWLLLAFAMMMFAGGDILYGLSSPPPSPSDMFYVSAYPLFMLGLIGISRSNTTKNHPAIIDVAAIAACLGLLMVTFLFAPLLGTGDGIGAVAIAVGYPVLDIALLRVAVRIYRGHRSLRAPVMILAGGLGLMLLADIGYALEDFGNSYVVGSLLDPLWLLAYLCFAAAALHPAHLEGGAGPVPIRPSAGTPESRMDRYLRESVEAAEARRGNSAQARRIQGLRFHTVLLGVGSTLVALGLVAFTLAIAWQLASMVMLSGAYGGVGFMSLLAGRLHA